MPTYKRTTQTRQIRNLWIYPKACNLPNFEDVSLSDEYETLVEKYSPESRPYPADITKNLTGRAKVVGYVKTRGNFFKFSEVPCPHSGVHGMTRKYSYVLGLPPSHHDLLGSYNSLKSRNAFALNLREKIVKKRVNLGSSLAEYRESAKLFGELGKTLHKAYHVLRGRMRRRKLRVCSIPGTVLQANFGISPLVNDVYNSVETLRHKLKLPLRERLSVGIKIPLNGSLDSGGYTYNVKGLFSQRATIYYSLNQAYYLTDTFDFGNPIEWAWELIPFSFVVDWAIPIGEWLGSLDALLGISEIHGTVTTRLEEQIEAVWDQANIVLSPSRITSHSYERGLINSVPLPKFPGWKPSRSWRTVVNATALLFQVAKPCSQRR